MGVVVNTGEKRSLVERVLHSATFGKSPRLQEFLRYVAEKELLGHPEEIKESLIEREVFGRERTGADTDAAVVRVTARQLRLKLAQYFEDEGAHEPLVLEIPKGSYQPVFRARVPVPVPEEPVPASAPPNRIPWLLGGVLLGAVVVAAIALAETRIAQSPTLFRKLLLSRPGRVYLVTSDAGLFLRQKLWSKSIDLHTFLTEAPAPEPEEAFHRTVWGQLSRYSYTSFADLSTVASIYAAHPDAISRITARESRSLHPRDFSSDNFLIIGSAMANPWLVLFRDRLSFFIDYDLAAQKAFVEIRDPVTGVRSRVEEPGPPANYAHLACLGTGQGSGYAVLISGTTQAAREAVGSLLCERTLPSDLRFRISKASEWEALLKVEILQEVPRKVKVIQYREISAPIPSPALHEN